MKIGKNELKLALLTETKTKTKKTIKTKSKTDLKQLLKIEINEIFMKKLGKLKRNFFLTYL